LDAANADSAPLLGDLLDPNDRGPVDLHNRSRLGDGHLLTHQLQPDPVLCDGLNTRFRRRLAAP
jgi:hypothetical protein